MKKITIAIVLLCTLSSAYSLDYRQVIFGNSYQNILEIDADSFFEQYPAVKRFTVATEAREARYARVYEQIIGTSTFYRAVFSYEKLREADFLDWENTNFLHFVFFKKSNTNLLQFGGCVFGRIDSDDDPEYEGLEIIERNNKVIGIMRYILSESDSSNNAAYYSSWQNILDNQTESGNYPTISYTDARTTITITASNALIDSRRPFMYTIQNAFDGNPATSYVEDTEDDMFRFGIQLVGWDYDEYPVCTSYKIINGYASGDYYYQNNQIAKVAVVLSKSTGRNISSKHASFQLHDTVKPQVMNFKGMESIQNESTSFDLEVEELTNGTLYNDTAMAEFDLYIEGEGWLFGSSDTNTVVASPATPNEYKYAIKDDGTAEIVSHHGMFTEIPSTIEYRGKPYTVTSIGGRAFWRARILTSVTIPDSITSIGKGAFYECNNLSSVTINGSVTSIGDQAFSKCFALTTVTINSSVTFIGERAFYECINLTNITIPDTVTSIGDYAFASCGRLANITIPNSVISIGEWAFGYSKNLTVSVYPDSYALEYVQKNDIPYVLMEGK